MVSIQANPGNASSVASHSSASRSFPDRFSDVFNVKDFGATGDGITDDAAAVQAAMDAAIVVGQANTIYFPPGIYKLTDRVEATIPDLTANALTGYATNATHGLYLIGDGPTTSKIVADADNSTGLVKINCVSNQDIIQIRDLGFYSILDQITNVTQSNGTAIHIYNSNAPGAGWSTMPNDTIAIENVVVGSDGWNVGALFRQGMWDYGIIIENFWQPRLTDVRVRGGRNGDWALSYADRTTTVGAADAFKTAVFLKHCYMPKCTNVETMWVWEKGIHLLDSTTVQGTQSIEDGIFLNCGGGYADDVLHIEHTWADDDVDVLAGGSFLYEPGLSIIGGHYKGLHNSIRIKGRRQVLVQGIRFYVLADATQTDIDQPSAIWLEKSGDALITGNQFSENGWYTSDTECTVGVRISGAHSRGIAITGNHFKNGGIGILNEATDTVTYASDETPVPIEYSIVAEANHFGGQGVWGPFKKYLDTTGFMTVRELSRDSTNARDVDQIISTKTGAYGVERRVTTKRPDYAANYTDVSLYRELVEGLNKAGVNVTISEVDVEVPDLTGGTVNAKRVYKIQYGGSGLVTILTLDGTTGLIDAAYGFSIAGGPTVKSGSGSPEGTVTAPIGSLWLRTDGGANTAIYAKESGTGNTGWVGK